MLQRKPKQVATWIVTFACILLVANGTSAAERPVPSQGTARFVPTNDEVNVPARFRLPEHEFPWQERLRPKVSDRISISDITFPSPVVTDCPENNWVHCEYYRPNVPGKVPGVVVLHILGGDFPLARVFANSIAQRGVAALFLKMPYYGPRRPANSKRRMVSQDPSETVAGMTQAILDIRQGVAWLASREEINADELGVFGISLGGITGALAMSAEPRLKNGCLILAGGGMGEIAWESTELNGVREAWLSKGRTKEEFFQVLQPIDPLTYAASVKNRRILMLNAKDDEVVPKPCTETLWRAFGEPEILWYDGGHYSVARHLLDAMKRTQDFFANSQ